ncbi:MAG: SAM-dependent methyltransferase [Bacteroidota bacterium]|nr:SAM-dependent methyltransferase [Bacteroidota bacterium]
MHMNEETKRFITEHGKEDIFTLKLKYRNNSEVNIDLAIRQITGKQKIKSKVPLFYHTEDLLYPVQLSLEQSSSESTAMYKSTLCEGNSLVDLTGGFGVDCCFMSEHFQEVTYVERQPELCELARHNFKTLHKDHIRVVNSETENYLTEMGPVDWIYLDPARRGSGGKKVVLLSDCEPDVSALSSLLLEKANRVMIKLSPMMDITAATTALPHTSEIHIISVENECKEILLILNQTIQDNKKIITLNIGKHYENQLFDYYLTEETTAAVAFTSEIKKYLYEPNASVMKSGAFKLTGSYFKLCKLHNNTHLYTSNELVPQFPGRVFKVVKTWGHSKNEMKEMAQQLPTANITTRNYPISVDELRKKLKIKEGGDTYLFACTLNDEHKAIIETKKLSGQHPGIGL